MQYLHRVAPIEFCIAYTGTKHLWQPLSPHRLITAAIHLRDERFPTSSRNVRSATRCLTSSLAKRNDPTAIVVRT
jgi:hypothetical protein